MSFIKSFIATVLTAATLVVAPVQARGLTYTQELLISTLEDAGVELVAEPCEREQYYGLYSPKFNAILICTNVARSIEQRWETLRHEAIHVAQRCINPRMEWMVHSQAYVEYYASAEDARLIMRNYEPEDWAIELEAFTFMRWSNEYVADMVIKSCKL